MILRPPEPITILVVRIEVVDDMINVRLAEKSDRLRDLVKCRQFKWDWDANVWYRVITAQPSPIFDRAAELAHVLLAAGFIIEVDDDIAQMALNVSYQPEKRRQIRVLTGGNWVGWFAVSWPRDMDYWSAAWALPGSKYAKPFVAVPPEHYEAILDFAEAHDFYITPAAQRLIDDQEERQRSAVLVDVPPLPTPQPTPTFALDLSEEMMIDPSLADDDE